MVNKERIEDNEARPNWEVKRFVLLVAFHILY